jgi:uncharacterized protein YodC (DUF2158 family)
MTDAQIKPGSIVQLKSGGPNMTVSWVEKEVAYCEWFIQDKAPWKRDGKRFALTSLKLLEP